MGGQVSVRVRGELLNGGAMFGGGGCLSIKAESAVDGGSDLKNT